ncbi:MAG TPA: redoxin domain-containing protein, partial [Desulfobacter postgatei]|nr:redoxin domain-containing protein [Desulfobacter postgatei]
ILYFYPKDDTPGCTVEACSLRDARDELAEQGADEAQQLDCYRKVRDEIKAFVEKLPENINSRIA